MGQTDGAAGSSCGSQFDLSSSQNSFKGLASKIAVGGEIEETLRQCRGDTESIHKYILMH